MTENQNYLTEQLISYIGNKRSLLNFIQQGIEIVQKELNKTRLTSFDVFSGSGVVSRFLKKYSSHQYANDMENYASIISNCYLTNQKDINFCELTELHEKLIKTCKSKMKTYLNSDETAFTKIPGFISEYYAPKDLNNIQKGERCFYTPYNACYIDCVRQLISEMIPLDLQKFFIAPLLSECSIHANTGGVFKGFYKNSKTGIGKFGGNASNALNRIQGHINLSLPFFSAYKSNFTVFQNDANLLVKQKDAPKVNLAYIDPPYNQHPYGSNYFMLNLIADYKCPNTQNISLVSGIPKDWNRSNYNKRKIATESFKDLVENLDAKYLLISFNNEGFISEDKMISILESVGKLRILESNYNTYRASRNLSSRAIHTKEYLYIVQK